MKRLLFPFRLILSLLTGTLQLLTSVAGLATLLAVCWVGPPAAPPRLESVMLPPSSATTPFERGVMGLALQHTDWKVSRPTFVSFASGRLPNGQDITFIGLCGRWIPLPEQF